MEKDLELIQILWDNGCYTLKELYNRVKNNEITEDEFKEITGYSFKGVKKSREWV